MQPAHGNDGATSRACLQRRMVGVAFPQAGQKVSHVGRRHVRYLGPPGHRQGSRVAPQVAAVSLERVLGKAALDCKMVEVAPDRAGQRGQLSTSATPVAGSPCASATGAHVTIPACVFSPEAREASRDSASRQPRLAISIAYGSVTFVSA